MKRLLSSTDCSTQRVILIDNVKTHRFSWADVEALITSDRINGRKLYIGDGSRPNHFVVAITLNGASLSKDMAQRCIIVKLRRPKSTDAWESETAAFIEENRQAILGDLVAHLKRPVPRLSSFSRWGAWEAATIARLANPESLQRLIRERANEVDDDQEEANLIREAIADEIRDRGHGDPNEMTVRIPCRTMVEIVNRALQERLTATAVGTKLKALAGSIAEIKKCSNGKRRFWLWSGKDCNSTWTEDLRERNSSDKW